MLFVFSDFFNTRFRNLPVQNAAGVLQVVSAGRLWIQATTVLGFVSVLPVPLLHKHTTSIKRIQKVMFRCNSIRWVSGFGVFLHFFRAPGFFKQGDCKIL